MPQMQMLDLELLVNSRYPFIAVTTDEEDRLQDMLRRLAVRLAIPFYVWTPVEGLIRPPLKELASPHDRQPLQALAQVAASREDGLTLFEAERAITRVVVEDMALTRSDCDRIIEIKKQVLEREGYLEFWPRTEGFAAVGGLRGLKAWLERRRRAFTDQARDFGLDPPKGLLLLGVQGCGKSLCAKAIAREWELPLLKLEPGRLYEKYIGESEKRLERALDLAARLAPVVLWIDEFEKGFAAVSQSESDAGLSKRIFGRLLAWLQDRPAPVFVVATCNDVLSLPPELMRKGRFDEIFFVDLPGLEDRSSIFAIHIH